MTSRQAAIYGLSGLELTSDEIDYISKASPLGFILFSRNINNLPCCSDKAKRTELCPCSGCFHEMIVNGCAP